MPGGTREPALLLVFLVAAPAVDVEGRVVVTFRLRAATGPGGGGMLGATRDLGRLFIIPDKVVLLSLASFVFSATLLLV